MPLGEAQLHVGCPSPGAGPSESLLETFSGEDRDTYPSENVKPRLLQLPEMSMSTPANCGLGRRLLVRSTTGEAPPLDCQ